jgi:DNA-binding MarR family transcriptional regulator
MAPMTQLFDTAPVRTAARRGSPSRPIRRAGLTERWPPAPRDPVDAALVAVRVLEVSGRIRSRLRRAARAGGVEPDLVALLLLFAQSNRSLRVVEIAELLGVGKASASRLARRAEAAGLIDKLTSSIDGREVVCRLSLAGRAAVVGCLDSLRPIATQMLGHPDREWLQRAHELLAPASSVALQTRNWGWRAGVRVGMTDQE